MRFRMKNETGSHLSAIVFTSTMPQGASYQLHDLRLAPRTGLDQCAHPPVYHDVGT